MKYFDRMVDTAAQEAHIRTKYVYYTYNCSLCTYIEYVLYTYIIRLSGCMACDQDDKWPRRQVTQTTSDPDDKWPRRHLPTRDVTLWQTATAIDRKFDDLPTRTRLGQLCITYQLPHRWRWSLVNKTSSLRTSLMQRFTVNCIKNANRRM